MSSRSLGGSGVEERLMLICDWMWLLCGWRSPVIHWEGKKQLKTSIFSFKGLNFPREINKNITRGSCQPENLVWQPEMSSVLRGLWTVVVDQLLEAVWLDVLYPDFVFLNAFPVSLPSPSVAAVTRWNTTTCYDFTEQELSGSFFFLVHRRACFRMV